MATAQPLPKIELQPVFPDLKGERPVWMSEAPDGSGRFFVVYQAGQILVVKKGSDGSDAKEFLNIEDRHPYFENEDGLLSIAFHPGFKTNGLFYIYYNQKNSPDQHSRPLNYPYRSVISEFKVSAAAPDKADLNSERILFEVQQPFSNHKGGELAFGPDGYLYLGLGDGGAADDPFGSGQNTATLLAKMLRIDVNTRSTIGRGRYRRELQYGIPADNPFVNEPDMGDLGTRKEIYAYGLRNPWRYSWDRQTGALWVGDVGQDLWEEVDLVVKGGNYGWNVREGAHHFKPGPPGAQYIDPVMEYPHRPSLLSAVVVSRPHRRPVRDWRLCLSRQKISGARRRLCLWRLQSRHDLGIALRLRRAQGDRRRHAAAAAKEHHQLCRGFGRRNLRPHAGRKYLYHHRAVTAWLTARVQTG